MKPLESSLTASLFSLGEGGHSAAEAMLPSDALVIVIQNRADEMGYPPLIRRHFCERPAVESLPVLRRKAEKAYSEHLRGGIYAISISG
jgi:hypothetical protein